MMGDSIRRRTGRGARRGQRKQARAHTRARAGEPSLDLKRWVLAGLGGALLAFVFGWLLATQVLFPKPALARDEVAVPDLTGLDLEEARAELASLRLEVGTIRELTHPNADRGAVVAQDPIGGQRLRPGAEVRLAVSEGRPRVTVPDLAGVPVDEAMELARRVGFETERAEEPSVEPAGRVLRTRPPAGQQIELPARLTIVVSAGGIVPPEPTPGAIDSSAPGVEESGNVTREGIDD